MLMKKAKKDFDYVLKVLESCKNHQHLIVTQKLFENFKKKWKGKIYDLDLISFMYNFESEYKKKKDKL